MKTSTTSRLTRFSKLGALTLLALAACPATLTQAADLFWTGGTASYTNAANWGGTVPGPSDRAINDNGSGNVVQINIGDPDWIVNQIRAGFGAGNGAFMQNGQNVYLTNAVGRGAVRLGVAAGRSGAYTINGGALNYTGEFNVGELGTATLNVNGGAIVGSGNLAINVGSSLDTVTATMGGTNKSDYTWFEQGFYTPDGTRGIPPAGSTFISEAQADHSYTMPANYAANNAVQVFAGVPNATITFTAPTAASALSFLGSAGFGNANLSYVVHHADTTTQTGTLTVPDWFDNVSTVAQRAGGRISANGLGIQIINDGPNKPYLLSLDVVITNTTSPVTSVDLTYVSGGVAAVLAVSSSTGGNFDPKAITGYNQDIVVEVGAPIYVANTVTDVLNQTGGVIDITGEFWIGNYGTAIYNLGGGSNSFRNWFALGRSGGNGTLNMTGGELNKLGGGNLLVGTGFQAPAGSSPTAVFNHSGGTINCANEFLVPENSPATGTYNVNGAAVLNANNWIAVGRNGGTGELNLTNGVITKAGGGNIVIGGGGPGTVNQYGGSITNTATQTWLGENASGTWNVNGGSATVGLLSIARTATSAGTLNANGGVLRASEITTGDINGSSTLNLNGGTIQPTGDSLNFIHDLTFAYVGAGGAFFDSAGYNVTVAQALQDNGGGLTKNGAGTLTLTGGNTYSGATAVNAGKLVTTTAATTPGNCTVANNAGFGVVTHAANAQHVLANLTLSGPTAASLDFILGAFGNPTIAPLGVTGTFDVSGTVSVNIADDLPQIGQFPLIQYGTRTGAGSFVIGTIPVGVVANIVTNGNNIELNITSVNLPRWDGNAGGNWDIGLTANWINIGTGLPTTYGQGNFVLFDDNAAGTTTVNLTTTVNPGSVTINNTNLNYAMVGAGKISGAIGLTKQGSGTFAMLNTGGNNYTGPTVLNGGTLSVTNLANGGSPSAIGASSANPTNLVLAGGSLGGALSYAGPATTINRGYSISTVSTNAIETLNNLTLSGTPIMNGGGELRKTGPAQLSYTGTGSNALSGYLVSGSTYRIVDGTVLLDGSAGSQTNYARNLRLGINDGISTLNTAMILTNTVLDVRNGFNVGDHNNATGTLIMENSTVFHRGNGNNFVLGDNANGLPCFGVVTQNNSTLNLDGEFWVGQTTNGFGTYTLNSGAINLHNWGSVGRAGGSGLFTMNGGTLTRDGNGTAFLVADGGGSQGLFNQSGGVVNIVGKEFWVGQSGGSVGTYNLSAGSLNVGNWVAIGRQGGNGTFNMSGGTFTKTGGGNFLVPSSSNSRGTLNHSAGTINVTSGQYLVPEGGNATTFGTNNISGTAVVTVNSWVAFGRGSGFGLLNMSGGLFAKVSDAGSSLIVGANGPGWLTQTGGTISNTVSSTWISEGSTATWDLSSGSAILGFLQFARNGSGVATLNFNGGTIAATEIAGGGGLATNNYNGGTIRARASTANFLHDLDAANVLAGGLIVDTDTNTIGVAQALLDGGGAGGLTKNGTGTLNLNGVNTYTGTTLVNAGTLGGTGTIAGPVSVASGAAFAPGASIGTLTINNTLTLAAGSTTQVEVRMDGGATNDVVTGLTALSYNGNLVVSNVGTNPLVAGTVFKLFNSAAPGSGNFTSVTFQPAGIGTFNPATGELTITSSGVFVVNPPVTSGGNLILTGSGGTPGGSYTVLTSPNVATPQANWTTNLTGTLSGTGSYSNAVPINVGEATRFFRVRQP